MSIRSMSVLAWMASMSLVWALFVPSVLSWTGLGWLSLLGFLALSTTLTLVMRSSRSVGQVIADTEAEPAPVVASRTRGEGAS